MRPGMREQGRSALCVGGYPILLRPHPASPRGFLRRPTGLWRTSRRTRRATQDQPSPRGYGLASKPPRPPCSRTEFTARQACPPSIVSPLLGMGTLPVFARTLRRGTPVLATVLVSLPEADPPLAETLSYTAKPKMKSPVLFAVQMTSHPVEFLDGQTHFPHNRP